PLDTPRVHSEGTTDVLERTLLRLELDDGTVGWGEVPARVPATEVAAAAADVVGEDPWRTSGIRHRIVHGKFYDQRKHLIAAGVEIACLDAVGQLTGRSVSDLLGGPHRDRIPVIGYVFEA